MSQPQRFEETELRSRTTLVVAVASMGCVVGSAASQAGAVNTARGATETFYVDSRDAGGATGSLVLAANQTYTVTVKGTFSAWTSWTHKRCGAVEPAPVYPSPDRLQDTPVGYDSEFKFAAPADPPKTCRGKNLPRATNVFQMRAASTDTWAHPAALNVGSRPRADHTYSYSVVGEGAPLQVRVLDHHYVDNNGRLRITIRQGAGA
jgi:hypothetical protein